MVPDLLALAQEQDAARLVPEVAAEWVAPKQAPARLGIASARHAGKLSLINALSRVIIWSVRIAGQKWCANDGITFRI